MKQKLNSILSKVAVFCLMVLVLASVSLKINIESEGIALSFINEVYGAPAAPKIVSPNKNVIDVDTITLEWTKDSGVRGFSFQLSQDINSIPDNVMDKTGKKKIYTGIAPGVWYFTVRAVDFGGNWGPASQFPVIYDVDGIEFFVNNETGSDDNYGLSWATAYKTIQRAIDNSPDNVGKVIYVAATVTPYLNTGMNVVNISRNGESTANPIKLISSHPNPTNVARAIIGSSANAQNNGIVINGNCIEVEGFKIEYSVMNGIRLSSSQNVIINDNLCLDNGQNGILLDQNSANNLITGNTCNNNNNGLSVENGCNNNVLSGNTSANNGNVGIAILSSTLNTVQNNTITGQKVGIKLVQNSRNNQIIDNNLSTHINGIIISGGAQENSLMLNRIDYNTESGIQLISSYNNLVDRNDVNNSTQNGINIIDGSVQNIITGNECSVNKNGIALNNGCNENEITGNTSYDNANNGINVYTSDENEISNNDCQGNSKNGIALGGGSQLNVLNGNLARDNDLEGIVLNNGDQNTLSANQCSGNKQSGILLTADSDDNTVTGNTLKNNTITGAKIDETCQLNNVTLNNIYSNKNGIIVYKATDNNIEGNQTFGNSANGISLDKANNNTIADNNAYNNDDSGIKLFTSLGNIISGNTCDNNTKHGIILEKSPNNILKNNAAGDNSKQGIFIRENSHNCQVLGNSCTGNTSRGIFVDNADNIYLAYNDLNNNDTGIQINNSVGHNVYKNIALNNINSGVYMFNADIVTLLNNVSTENKTGFLIDKKSSTTVFKNMITKDNTAYGINKDGTKLTVTYSDIVDSVRLVDLSTGTITTDPLFKNPGGLNPDYHLLYDSPAIETGEDGVSMGRYTVSAKQQVLKSISDYAITFKSDVVNGSIPADGKIVIAFPAAFDMTGISGIESTTMDGSLGFAVNGQVLTITRSGGTATAAGGVEKLLVKDLEIHTAALDFTIVMETRDASDNVIDIPETSNDFEIKFDNTPPVTTLDLINGVTYTSGSDIYVSGSTKVQLTAVDIQTPADSFASGVDVIQYKIDSDVSWNTYSAPLALSEGAHTVYYRSIDVVGNIEATQDITVKVDDTKPESDITFGSPNYTDMGKVFITSDSLITINSSDPISSGVASGLKITSYKINSGPWIEYTAAFKLPDTMPDGDYTITFFATDNVENAETENVSLVYLDNTPPAVPDGLVGYVEDTVNIALFWNEVIDMNLAGYNVYENSVKLNDEILTEASYFIENETGEHTYRVSSIDLLGNESALSDPVTVKIDNVITITYPESEFYYRQQIKVEAEILTAKKAQLVLEYGEGQNPAAWTTIKEYKNYTRGNDLFKHPWNLFEIIGGEEVYLNGVYRLRIRVEDKNGSYEDSQVVWIDNTAPETELVVDGDSVTFNPVDPEVNGIASGIKNTRYIVSENPITSDDDTIIWDNDPIVLAPGTYYFMYYSEDNAEMGHDNNGNKHGNIEENKYDVVTIPEAIIVSEPAPEEITGDSPEIEIIGAGNGYYRDDICFTVSISDADLISWYIGMKKNSTIIENIAGESSVSQELCTSGDGNYSVVVKAVDKSQNAAVSRINFVIDSIEPLINIAVVKDGGVYNSVQPVINVLDENLKSVTIELLKNGNKISWDGELITEAGKYSLEVIAEDMAGNVAGKDKIIEFVVEGQAAPEKALLFSAEYDINTDADIADGDKKDHSGGMIIKGGKEGNALISDIDGKQNFARYKSANNIDSGKGTIMMWANPSWDSAEYKGEDRGRHLFSLYNSEDGQVGLLKLAVFKDKGTTACMNTIDKDQIACSIDTDIEESDRWYKDGPGKWTHLTLSWDSEKGIIKIYVDGELKGTKISEGWNLIGTDNWMKVGGSAKVKLTEFQGKIDKFKIYDAQLTDEQVNQIFSEEVAE